MTLGIALVGLGAIAVFLRRRLFAPIDRKSLSWVDAWLKTLYIVVAIAVLVVIVPSRVLELDAVAELDRNAQDLIGTGLSLGGLVVVLLGLRLAQEHDRI